MTKPSEKFLWLALVISLVFNVYRSSSSQDKAREVLASVGNESFRGSDFTPASKKILVYVDYARYALLKKEAEAWIEKIILPKEASAQGKSVEELLHEISQKSHVDSEEVIARLAHSPAADPLPYPQVLKDIENDLRNARSQELKKDFLEGLYPKYQARVKIPLPAEIPPHAADAPTRFPAYEPPANGDPSKGPADAPVTVEIYSDFMCPFSARFFNTMAEAEKQYPGKIRTVFHQFPLPMHEGAHLMAEASLCAQEQGKFWEFHDRLMGQQKGKIEKEGLIQIAKELGLDAPSFQTCVEGGKNTARVDQDVALGRMSGVSGTPGYKINGRSGFGAVPFETLKPLIDWCLNPQGKYPGLPKAAPSAPAGAARAPGNELDPAKTYALDPGWLKKSPSQGPQNAPVTLVEFVDFNCPFCQRGSGTVEPLMEKYKGKVRLISKHFPLPMHPNAKKAAVAAACAAEQGKFWEYRQEMFGPSWGKQSVEDLKAAAKKIGLKEKDFGACLDQDKTKELVEEDMQKAVAMGVQGVPAYFINGTPLVGAQPAENFEKAIEAKLVEKKK